MFKKLNLLKYKNKKKKYLIPIDQLDKEINEFDDFFIVKNNNDFKVFDRVCDHAGGKLISKNNKIICPIHQWEFCTKKLAYKNGVMKREIQSNIKNGLLKFSINNQIPVISKIKRVNSKKIELLFYNHAFIIIKTQKFSFALDPWALGSAFNTGWWLKKNTKKNWLSELSKCNFIFISHNHPDHLHFETLEKLKKEIKIIVPQFSTMSVYTLLKDKGFKNIETIEFNYEYLLKNSNLIFSIIKSGDFREDSGIYFSIGNFTSLFDVDANNINFGRLPKVSLYGSSFSGGASGYPIMFDNYNLTEKKKIIKINKYFLKNKKINNIKKIAPKYFFPYASFFEEKLKRDFLVKELNKKNTIDEYIEGCKNINTEILNTNIYDKFLFKDDNLIKKSKIKSQRIRQINPERYLQNFKNKNNSINDKEIIKYFVGSKFNEKLNLIISTTDDQFRLIGKNYFIEFNEKKIICNKVSKTFIQKYTDLKKKNKFLYLKIRNEAFINTLKNRLPWEDLLIGFQCKVFRNPNIYNVKFWYYFTNIYITKNMIKEQSPCNSCNFLSQFVDNEIFINKY